tara:strand:+ start:26 stop:244 length:219 start_codon:yes stop_codon:yes gene_type:complete
MDTIEVNSIRILQEILIQRLACYEYIHQPFNNREKIDKALKRLPYQQTKQQFAMTAIDQYIDYLIKNKQIKK